MKWETHRSLLASFYSLLLVASCASGPVETAQDDGKQDGGSFELTNQAPFDSLFFDCDVAETCKIDFEIEARATAHKFADTKELDRKIAAVMTLRSGESRTGPSQQEHLVRFDATGGAKLSMSATFAPGSRLFLDMEKSDSSKIDSISVLVSYRKSTTDGPVADASCDDDGYLDWLERLQDKLKIAGSILAEKDRAAIDLLFALMVCGDTEAAYLSWLEANLDKLAWAGGTVQAYEQYHLDTLLAARPRTPAVGDDGYTAWFQAYSRRVVTIIGPLKTRDHDALDRLLELRWTEENLSASVYLVWFEAFVDTIRSASFSVDDNERARIQLILDAKPCAPDGAESSEEFLDFADSNLPSGINELVLQGRPGVCP